MHNDLSVCNSAGDEFNEDDSYSLFSSDSDSSMESASSEDSCFLTDELFCQNAFCHSNPNEEVEVESEIDCSTNDKNSNLRENIGSFNIKNQFNHAMAAALFLSGNFSILAFQEPFAFNTAPNKTWISTMAKELNKTRIDSFFTKHQAILLDNSRWGGRMLDKFSQYLDGRIVSFAVNAGNKQSWGFI